jgi:hypothetical protein
MTINSIFIQNPSRATRSEYHQAINTALDRAKQTKVNVGVFEDKKGELHVQNMGINPLRYFGKFGLLYSTQIV